MTLWYLGADLNQEKLSKSIQWTEKRHQKNTEAFRDPQV